MICRSCKVPNDDDAENCIGCGKGLLALVRGDVLSGRYEILDSLGRGGMGVVYKARDRELDETVAIKVLRPSLALSSDVAKRFRSEIKLARRVRHQNVCAIHEYGQEGALRYIVMEYLEGVDLRQVLRKRGALPPREAFEIAIQVASGLQAIHSLGIVHRDLKTPNLMRDPRGLVRLMDFGVAKQLGAERLGSSAATQTGHVVGTPEYMSPEQARGEAVDARSDIYALGIVIFELFTGDVPFRGDTPVATLLMHMEREPPLHAARLPGAILPVLRKALAKERRERYATAEEVARALREAEATVQFEEEQSTPGAGQLAVKRSTASGETTPQSEPVLAREPAPRTTFADVGAVTVTRTADAADLGPQAAGHQALLRSTASPRALGRLGAIAALVGAVLFGAVYAYRTVMVAPGPVAPSPAALVEPSSSPSPPPPLPSPVSRPAVFTPVPTPLPKPRPAISPEVTPSRTARSTESLPSPLSPAAATPPETLPSDSSHAESSAANSGAIPAPATSRPPSPASGPSPTLEDPPESQPARPSPSPEADTNRAQLVALRELLQRYQTALETKDLHLLKEIWPSLSGVTEREIRANFTFARSLHVDLNPTSWRVEGDSAVVVCARRDQLVSADGKEVERSATATFSLRRLAGAWLIDGIR